VQETAFAASAEGQASRATKLAREAFVLDLFHQDHSTTIDLNGAHARIT
jgi:hypothetical protein